MIYQKQGWRSSFRFSLKNTDVFLKGVSCEIRQHLCINEDCARNISVNGNKISVMRSHEAAPGTPDSLKLYHAYCSNVASPVESLGSAD